MDAPLHKIGHRRQPDMRVRAHVDALAGQEFDRAELIEEDEWPDHLTPGRRQRAAHFEPAQIAGAGNDNGFDGVDSIANRDMRIEDGVPAHVRPPDLRV